MYHRIIPTFYGRQTVRLEDAAQKADLGADLKAEQEAGKYSF